MTDPVIELLDRLQLDSGTGPALTMVAEGHDLLVVPDSRYETRWTAWASGLSPPS